MQYKILDGYAKDVQESLNKFVENGWEFVSMSYSEFRACVIIRKPK